jgi:hypothetical protein
MPRDDQKKKKKKKKNKTITSNTSYEQHLYIQKQERISTAAINGILIFAAFILCFSGVMAIFQFIEENKQVDHLALQLTDITLSADIHVDTTVAPAPTVLSPLTQTPCVAARLDISYTYTSSRHNKTPARDWTSRIFTLFVGPDPIPLLASNTPLAFPRSLWRVTGDVITTNNGTFTHTVTDNFWNGTTQKVTSLPPAIAAQIPPDLLADARKDKPKYFTLEEWIFTEDMNIFVVASVVNRDPSGTFILGPDPTLEEFILYPGLQTKFVRAHQNAFPGTLVIAMIFVVLGLISFAIFIYRKRKSTNPKNP